MSGKPARGSQEKLRRTAFAAAVTACLAACAVMACGGCGGKKSDAFRESLIEYALKTIIPGQTQQGFQLVKLQSYPLGGAPAGEGSDYERFWKIEGGSFTEIDAEEYRRLWEERIKGAQGAWQASEHSIIIRALNEEEGKAALEVDSLYGPLSGEGTVYYLEQTDGSWKIMEKTTAWVS